MNLPNYIKDKILLYNIHPVAEILKWDIMFITRRSSNQMYYPRMFRHSYSSRYFCPSSSSSNSSSPTSFNFF